MCGFIQVGLSLGGGMVCALLTCTLLIRFVLESICILYFGIFDACLILLSDVHAVFAWFEHAFHLLLRSVHASRIHQGGILLLDFLLFGFSWCTRCGCPPRPFFSCRDSQCNIIIGRARIQVLSYLNVRLILVEVCACVANAAGWNSICGN